MMINPGMSPENATHNPAVAAAGGDLVAGCEKCKRRVGPFPTLTEHYLYLETRGWEIVRLHGLDFIFCPGCRRVEG